MPVSYNLKINDSIVGTLTPEFGDSPSPGSTAGFKQTGATVQTVIHNFEWTTFAITLISNSQLPQSIAPGTYILRQNWRGPMTVKGDMTARPNQSPPTGSWTAEAEIPPAPTERNWYTYELKIGDKVFGRLAFDSSQNKVHFFRGTTAINIISWTSWASFSIDAPDPDPSSIYGDFPKGTYSFGGGHFTKLGNKDKKDPNKHDPKDDPTTWEATTQGVR